MAQESHEKNDSRQEEHDQSHNGTLDAWKEHVVCPLIHLYCCELALV